MLNTISKKTVHQAAYYLLATGLSAAITLGFPALLHELFFVEEEIAIAAGLFVAFIVNFLTTRLLVFRSSGNVTKELSRFVLVSLGFRIGEYLAFLVLHSILGVFYILAMAIVLVISLVLKFLTYRGYVFRSEELPHRPASAYKTSGDL